MFKGDVCTTVTVVIGVIVVIVGFGICSLLVDVSVFSTSISSGFELSVAEGGTHVTTVLLDSRL